VPKMLEDTSIDRYTAVAKVLAKVAGGMTLSRAIRVVSKAPVLCLNGRVIQPKVRTLQRWVAAFENGGIEALAKKSRRLEGPSQALTSDFISYLVKVKTKDPDASIPEVIRQARELGIVCVDDRVSRVSAWRAAKRLNLPIFATKGVKNQHMLRYGYPHRMLMNLGDGKHFRAGSKSRRRVVISFIDDATRFILAAAVGKTETSALFLACLWKSILRWGKPDCIFLDNGSGFIANDVATICARLDIGLVFGTEGYAEGHGKIERYHSTLIQDLLRTFRGNPEIDADCASLELRIEHYNAHVYNRRAHESLAFDTPESRFLADKRALEPIDDPDRIRKYFVITVRRKVSRDNIVKIRGLPYEMPRGYAGTVVNIDRHLLDRTVSVLHDGKMVVLSRVDTVLNAVTRRRPARKSKEPVVYVPVRTAATMAFERDHQPLVGKSGDCYEED
jgi:transposase InsO family protein